VTRGIPQRVMWVRADYSRTVVACFFFAAITLAVSAEARACDRPGVDRRMEEARQTFRAADARPSVEAKNEDYRKTSRLSSVAANEYLGCAAESSEAAYFDFLDMAASAYLLAGAAALLTDDESAVTTLFQARNILYKIARDGPVSLRQDASDKIARLERNVPQLKDARIDLGNVPGPLFPKPPAPDTSTYPPLRDYTVINSWITASPTGNYLHVRLKLHPLQSLVTRASEFRIVVPSNSGRSWVIYGLNGQAPRYQKTDYTASPVSTYWAPSIASSEDLGLRGQLRLLGGESITTVVTFALPTDVAVSSGVDATVRWQSALQGKAGYLGAYLEALSAQSRNQLGYFGSGVAVNQIAQGSPADRAGLRVGDVLQNLDGIAILDLDQAILTISNLTPGRTVEAQILRNGSTMVLRMTITARP